MVVVVVSVVLLAPQKKPQIVQFPVRPSTQELCFRPSTPFSPPSLCCNQRHSAPSCSKKQRLMRNPTCDRSLRITVHVLPTHPSVPAWRASRARLMRYLYERDIDAWVDRSIDQEGIHVQRKFFVSFLVRFLMNSNDEKDGDSGRHCKDKIQVHTRKDLWANLACRTTISDGTISSSNVSNEPWQTASVEPCRCCSCSSWIWHLMKSSNPRWPWKQVRRMHVDLLL